MHLDDYQNELPSMVDRTKKGTEAMKNDLKGVENEPAANELPDYQKI